MTPTVFLFAGQGSQFFGMGAPLFANNPVFRDTMRDLDDIARGLIGHSVIEAVHDSRRTLRDGFDRTLFTHPAILMTEVALACALEREGLIPDVVVGASLGELAALVVAGVLAAEDALEACLAQAEELEAHCEAGGMVAILDDVALHARHEWLGGASTIAGVNLARHFVVSASAVACDRIVERCGAAEISCHRLPVRVAFHSDAMLPAERSFLTRVASIPCAAPRVRVLSSARGGWLAEAAPPFLWELARSPIRFDAVLKEMARFDDAMFVDLSPGATLGTFIKNHEPLTHGQVNLSVITPFRNDAENFARVVATHRGRRAPRDVLTT